MADRYWSGRRSGPDPEETRGSGSWILEGPGGPCQVLERPWGLGVVTGGPLDLNQILVGRTTACVCVSVREAAGTPGGPGPATEQTV